MRQKNTFCGMAALFISIMMISLFLLLQGCSGLSITSNQNVDDTLKKIAISSASKKLGEIIAKNTELKWTDSNEKFVKYIEEHGLSIDSASIIGQYASTSIPELYSEEAKELAELVGFKVTVDGWEYDSDNFLYLKIAIMGFRAGVLSVETKGKT
jgi:hypothetical protein